MYIAVFAVFFFFVFLVFFFFFLVFFVLFFFLYGLRRHVQGGRCEGIYLLETLHDKQCPTNGSQSHFILPFNLSFNLSFNHSFFLLFFRSFVIALGKI